MNKNQYVTERGFLERLVKSVPTTINMQAMTSIPYLVRDYFSKWPSYTTILYCSLDYQIVIMFILLFSLFDRVTGSSIISIAIIYIIEKFLKYFRH